jgi:hypothetical protein
MGQRSALECGDSRRFPLFPLFSFSEEGKRRKNQSGDESPALQKGAHPTWITEGSRDRRIDWTENFVHVAAPFGKKRKFVHLD